MEKRVNVEKNWEIWQSLEGVVKKWVARKWSSVDLEDVFSAGMELFVRSNRGEYSQPQQILFAKLCCKRAARRLRFWTNQREFADGGEASAIVVGAGAAAVDQNLLVSQIIDFINIKCCRELRVATHALLKGEAATLAEAAAQAGLSEVVLSRHYRLLGRLLTGRARITSPRRPQNTQQLQLFLEV